MNFNKANAIIFSQLINNNIRNKSKKKHTVQREIIKIKNNMEQAQEKKRIL